MVRLDRIHWQIDGLEVYMTEVLIVDDSTTARMMLKHWVNAFKPDFRVFEANCGDEAIAQLNELGEAPVIFIDYNMPGMTGLELVARLEGVNRSRIALCTANIQEAIRERALGLGIRYIAKPITPAKVQKIFSEMEL